MLVYKPRLRTTEIILHATHTRPSKSGIEHFLKTKGRELGLLTCGYHFLITQDGELIETRPHAVQGTHTPGYNEESIGVVLAGGVSEEDEREQEDNFTDGQWDTLGQLVGFLEGTYGQLPVNGHTEKKRYRGRPWVCPPTDMEKVRERIRQRAS